MSSQWQPPGPNNVPSYQMSGLPFITGSSITGGSTEAINFPFVTRFIQVFNTGSNPVSVEVSENGVEGTNKFTVNPGSNSGVLELRVKKLFLRADDGAVEAEVVAGLTNIMSHDYYDFTGSLAVTGSGALHYNGVG